MSGAGMGGGILLRFIYLDLSLNVIPPIPALARFPRYRERPNGLA